ncbi:MHS family MFS transporter [Leucobacter sp. cx-42]|uniref:MFS transporter n=1 Tax=unclassified Leucobacter TaxID=2621730 RepID=UPI00165DF60F|nr:MULTISPECIES: MFS transporter [unclassified Leucobacter]MBC9953311.1 MHS family MFS transporter [Leucobacter sp. cx-42]
MGKTEITADQRRRRAVVGAFVGTAIEWYDFFIFGTAAALVFGPVFFPVADPAIGVLASFATFWVGFLARPIGGILFGHLGDKIGRKKVLVTTLFLMGIGTTAIGLLPTYAQVGILAPILLILLRAMQGLAVGGEWAGATVMATESAEGGKRTGAGMWVQQGSPAGSILATLVFLLVGNLPDEAFMSWGWRVPFLLSAVLLVVALVIRSRVEESEDFTKTQQQKQVVKVPLFEVFREMPGIVIFGIFASALGISAAFFQNTFLVSWWTNELQGDRQTILLLVFIMAVGQFIWQPISSLIATKIGRDRVMYYGVLLSIAITIPYFFAILSGNMVFLVITMFILMMGGAAYYAMLAGFLSSMFPPNVRYTGVALANGLCAVLIGGATPVIAQAILTASGPWGVAAFYIGISVLTIIGIWGATRSLARYQARVGAAADADDANATDPAQPAAR